MKTILNIIRVILIVPLLALLSIVVMVSPLLISIKYTLLDSTYLKNVIERTDLIEIAQENIFKETPQQDAQFLQQEIFSDKGFIYSTVNSGIDNLFLWLQRDTDELKVTADRQSVENKYLSILYSKIEEQVKDEFGININAEDIPKCKSDLSNDELQIRLINGKPCFPMDFKDAVTKGYQELGLVEKDSDSIVLFSVPKDKLSELFPARTIYWIVDNSVLLSVSTILLLTLLIIFLTPKKTVGYILVGVLTFLISTGNLAIFTATPYLDIQEVFKRFQIKPEGLTEDVAFNLYDQVLKIVLIDITNVGKVVAGVIILAVIVSSISIWAIMKRRKEIEGKK